MDSLDANVSPTVSAEQWLTNFASALQTRDPSRLAGLFAEDECYWRDILAFTWDLHTTAGADTIADRLLPAVAGVAPRKLQLAPGRAPPRLVKRAGTAAIEALFTFETAVGPCNGVVRLVPDRGGLRAWTLMTTLDEIRGHEDLASGRHWQDVDWKRNFGGENWADRRRREAAYAERDPEVLVAARRRPA